MKNLMLIVPSLKGGGAERVVSILSKEFSKKYNVLIVVFDSDGIAYSYGGNLISLNLKSKENIYEKFLNVLKRANKIKKIKRKYKIDYSISFADSANIVNILSKADEKVITSVHSSSISNNIIYEYVIKLLYNRSDKVIGVSKGIVKKLSEGYNIKSNKLEYIYNPIDGLEINKMTVIDECANSIKSKGTKKPFQIITMGRLTEAKGHWHLIRALSYVKKNIPNIKLNILGEGPLESYLTNLINNLDLKDNVKLLGYQSNPFAHVKGSDLFILSSLFEGFPNVLGEAMFCGVPIVSTDCRTGPREILSPSTDFNNNAQLIEYVEYGILIPKFDGIKYESEDPLTNNEILLGDLIISLYNDNQTLKKYSELGKSRVKDFDVENIVKEWNSLLLTL